MYTLFPATLLTRMYDYQFVTPIPGECIFIYPYQQSRLHLSVYKQYT